VIQSPAGLFLFGEAIRLTFFSVEHEEFLIQTGRLTSCLMYDLLERFIREVHELWRIEDEED